MNMKSLMKLGAAAAIGAPMVLATAGCSNAQKVYNVERVSVDRSAQTPYRVILSADGQTRTDGWTRIRLVPVGFNDLTGEYKFELKGDSPEGVGAAVMTPVSATYTMTGAPMNLKSVTVRTETNAITQTTFGTPPPPPDTPVAPEVSEEPAATEEPAPGVVSPKPQFEEKPTPEPKPEPAPAPPDDLEDALEK